MAAVNLKEGNAKLNKESSATTIVAENESLKALQEENAKLKKENESLKLNGKSKFTESKVQG